MIATIPERADRKQSRRVYSEVLVFILFAYLISLALWLPALLDRKFAGICLPLGTFGPTFAALITIRIFHGTWKSIILWTGLCKLMRGTAVGIVGVLIAAFTAALLMTESGVNRWRWSSLILILTIFGPNLIGGPLGEEAGWRGYALTRLQESLNPTFSAILVGLVWANWHIPLMMAHIYNVSWGQFVALTVAASVILAGAFNLSGKSVLCTIIVHGVYNVGTGVILNDLINRATLYSNEVQHNLLWGAYSAVAGLFILLTRGNLGNSGEPGKHVDPTSQRGASGE